MNVWALFDSETDCVKKALPECEVYSFGIGGGTGHIVFSCKGEDDIVIRNCFGACLEVGKLFKEDDKNARL